GHLQQEEECRDHEVFLSLFPFKAAAGRRTPKGSLSRRNAGWVSSTAASRRSQSRRMFASCSRSATISAIRRSRSAILASPAARTRRHGGFPDRRSRKNPAISSSE